MIRAMMNRTERRRNKRNKPDSNELLNYVSNTCLVSALDDYGVDMQGICTVLSNMDNYMGDYTEYFKLNGGIDMIENNELHVEVKQKIRQYMAGKMDKSKGIRLLRNEFNLPNAVLSDLWIECKSSTVKKTVIKELYKHSKGKEETVESKFNRIDELMDDQTRKEVVNAVDELDSEMIDYCKSPTKEDKLKKTKELYDFAQVSMRAYAADDVKNTVIIDKHVKKDRSDVVDALGYSAKELKKVGNDSFGQMLTSLSNIKEKEVEKKVSNLKILREYKDVEGIYGKYTKIDDTVVAEGTTFESVESVELARDGINSNYDDLTNKITADIKKLMDELAECEELRKKRNSEYDEIVSVFEI